MRREDFRRIRSRLRLTQAALADLLGVHAMTVNAWELKQKGSPKRIPLMAAALMKLMDEHGADHVRRVVEKLKRKERTSRRPAAKPTD